MPIYRALRAWEAICLTLILALAAIISLRFALSLGAKNAAQSFCGGVGVGSDISLALERANARGISYRKGEWYTFYFPGAFFDTAVCDVGVDDKGLVTTTHADLFRD
jgi:hypothetical protein